MKPGELEAFQEKVVADRAAQGLPPKVTDPVVLDKIAVILHDHYAEQARKEHRK